MGIRKSNLQNVVKLLPGTFLVFTNVFIFTTFDVYRGNPTEFEAGYLDMLKPLFSWGLPTILLTLLPGLIFSASFVKRYASFLLVLGILTWIQAGALMWDYGVFDGRGTNWDQYDLFGWLDIGLWLCLLAVSLRFASRILPYSNIVALILIGGQVVILASQGGLKPGGWTREDKLTSPLPDAIFEVSKQQNIIHIVLDSMQTDVFLELAEKHDLADEFSGFTVFYENAGVSPHTSLALPAIFSGEVFDGSQSPSSYYKAAMTDGFQNKLFEAGFTVNLIPQMSMLDSSYTNYYKITSVYKGTRDDLERQNAAQLLDIALFRSAPHFLRKVLYDGGEWFLLPLIRGSALVESFQIKAFFRDYTRELKLGSDTPTYHFMHLMPPHPPYVTLEDGSYAGRILPNTRENYLNESRAIIDLIVQFLQKLKSLGVYDNSMIILQGDHGSQIRPLIDGTEIHTCVSRMAALLAVKPQAEDGELKISSAATSLLDVAPTVMKILDDEARSVFDVDNPLTDLRPFIVFDGKSAVTRMESYSIRGSVFDPQSCKREGSLDVDSGESRYELGDEIKFGMTGNGDPFMGPGWSACQSDYCWSVGGQADLELPMDKADTDLLLHVRFKPYIDEIKVPQQRVGVSVNGAQLTEWLVTDNRFQNVTARIPVDLAQGEKLQIRFNFPDAVAPKSLGLGGDTRLLGVAIRTLQIVTPDDE